jgi:hypothetical protein
MNLGGLGILNSEILNIALLSKWPWKLFNGKGMCQNLLNSKYLIVALWGKQLSEMETLTSGEV